MRTQGSPTQHRVMRPAARSGNQVRRRSAGDHYSADDSAAFLGMESYAFRQLRERWSPDSPNRWLTIPELRQLDRHIRRLPRRSNVDGRVRPLRVRSLPRLDINVLIRRAKNRPYHFPSDDPRGR